MLGAEVISRTLATGRFLGVGVGSSPAEAEAHLGENVRQVHGREPHRYLRLDFGLVEATFSGEPDWACQWFSIHTHRLEEVPGLTEEVREKYGLEFSDSVTWGQLSPEVRQSADRIDPPHHGGYSQTLTRYRVPCATANIYLSSGPEGDALGQVIEQIQIGV
ncbi:hypothetical protein [Streptomyces cellulosae]|uniref:hypothetical protein n=1 Tax=Streptomyces cellulosae TaxID=1968 RepID=UPI00131E4034|nr:hypothetical protein [Streptomyces cellulosae]